MPAHRPHPVLFVAVCWFALAAFIGGQVGFGLLLAGAALWLLLR